MFGYQRSVSYGTAIERILYGSFTDPSKSNAVLVKGNSLELLKLASNPEENNGILNSCFEQPALGTITDARTLHCRFRDSENDSMTTTTTAAMSDMDYEDDDDLDQDDDDLNYDDMEIPYIFKLREGHARIPGNDVIVAVSEYGKLVFWTVASSSSTPQFTENDLEKTGRFERLLEVYMDEPGLEYNKVCKKLAIDPHSRAIAVSSFQDRFDIFILRDSMSRTNFNPIIGMGSVEEEGIIWHMEFLHTESTTMDRILLALVVYSDVDHQCRTIVYSVDASNADDILIERIGRLPLDTSTPVPILLIPLRHYPEALVLLTEYEAGIVTTDDIACGNMLYPTCPIERPFGEVKCPLFTAYIHCPESNESADYYVYLGADDGSLYKMIFPSCHEIQWEILDPINTVAPAMAMLGTIQVIDEINDQPYLADVLFYAGESADSQIIAVDRTSNSSRAHIVLQTWTSRAPIVDSRLASVMTDEQNVVLSCSGQGKHGALTLISRGVQTSLLHKSTCRWDGFNRLWNTQAPVSESTITPVLVGSSALETRLLCIQDGELSDITDISSIYAHQRTIAAGFVKIVMPSQRNKNRPVEKSIFVQICKNDICLIDNVNTGHTIGHWSPKAFDAEKDYVITLATITHSDIYPSQIILCLTDGHDHRLLPLDFVQEEQSMTLLPLLGAINVMEPSCIHHFDLQLSHQRRSILMVGTYEPSLLFYNLQGEGAQLLCERKLADFMGLETGAVPHSAIMLYGEESMPTVFDEGDEEAVIQQQYFLLIGLRQGTILSFPIITSNQQLGLSDAMPDVLNIGTCAVEFDTGNNNTPTTTPTTRKISVLALSDRLWRIKYNSICPQLLEVEPVLLPNFSSTIESVISLSLMDPQQKDQSVIGVNSDGYFYILHLSSKCLIGTRKIPIGETPNKILYDKSANCAFVVTTAMKDSSVKSTMRLIDLSISGSQTREKILLSPRDFGYSDEILCMTEWTVGHRDRTYRYICLGIGQKNMSNRSRIRKIGTERGVLMLYRLKSTDRNTSTDTPSPTLTTPTEGLNHYTLRAVWNQEHFPGGIFAICPHPAGLLFSAGPVLHLYQLDPRQGKLVEITRKALRFLITSIHVNDDKICVTCQNDSISFYTYNEEERKLDFWKSDTTARTVHHSVFINNQIAVGASQSGGLIALRDDPDDRSFEQRLLSVFSFHYPDIIIRPTLGSLLPRNFLEASKHGPNIASHVIPWTTASEGDMSLPPQGSIEPIMGSTVSGGLMTVHRISPLLFDLFSCLQDRLVHYGSSVFIPLGSAKDFYWFRGFGGTQKPKDRQRNVIYGDLLVLYLRLSPEQQQDVIQLDIHGMNGADNNRNNYSFTHTQRPISFLNAMRAYLKSCPALDDHGNKLKNVLVTESMATTTENEDDDDHAHDIDEEEEEEELLYTYSLELALVMDRLLRAMERYC